MVVPDRSLPNNLEDLSRLLPHDLILEMYYKPGDGAEDDYGFVFWCAHTGCTHATALGNQCPIAWSSCLSPQSRMRIGSRWPAVGSNHRRHLMVNGAENYRMVTILYKFKFQQHVEFLRYRYVVVVGFCIMALKTHESVDRGVCFPEACSGQGQPWVEV